MHNIAVMDFVWRNLLAEFEPDSVQEFDLVGSQVRSVRPKVEDLILATWKVELDGQLGFGIGQAFPGQTRETGILDNWGLVRCAQRDRRRLQTLRRTQYGLPAVGSGSNS